MDHLSARRDGSTDKNSLRDGLIEAVWDTLIALITIAGICIGVISLATHLNETSAVLSTTTRAPSIEVSQLPPGGAGAAASNWRLN